jgi:adenylate kinase family enzyme
MQRVVILGPPGSGKSTLARELGAVLGVPVFHLDAIYWRPGWVAAPREAFVAEIARIAALPGWITDGNYPETFPTRLGAADCLVYLDMPAWRTLPRIIRRIARGYGRPRADGPAGCDERFDAEFLRFAWTWNRIRRARSLELMAAFGGEAVVIRNRAERAALLSRAAGR